MKIIFAVTISNTDVFVCLFYYNLFRCLILQQNIIIDKISAQVWSVGYIIKFNSAGNFYCQLNVGTDILPKPKLFAMYVVNSHYYAKRIL